MSQQILDTFGTRTLAKVVGRRQYDTLLQPAQLHGDHVVLHLATEANAGIEAGTDDIAELIVQ